MVLPSEPMSRAEMVTCPLRNFGIAVVESNCAVLTGHSCSVGASAAKNAAGDSKVDAKERSTSLQWQVEKDVKAPAYMRGQWFLDTTDSGTTRVRLTLVIDPRHWPGSENLFSSERLASALRDFEKAAGKP